jgi:hypothetical protein
MGKATKDIKSKEKNPKIFKSIKNILVELLILVSFIKTEPVGPAE